MKQVILVLLAVMTIATGFPQQVHLENLKVFTDSLVHELVQDNQPGLSVVAIYKGQPVLNSHYGMMNLDYKMEASDSTSYNLASVSKHITAFGILLLEAEGKLNLEDKVGNYLGDLPKEFREVTIDQLLHHTAGIPSTDNLRLFAGIPLDNPWTQADELELLKKYPQLNFKPGTEYMYSNGGYSLLAAVIETASGEDFSNFFEQRVFNPLNLQAAAYDELGKPIENRARGYRLAGDNFIDALTEAESMPGASNFYFSPKDMLVWMDLLLEKNSSYEKQILKMIKPSFVLSSRDTIAYSYGLNVKNYKGVKAIYHSGGTPGFASYMMLFPEQELGISFLTNNEEINVAQLIRQLSDKLLSEFLIEEKPVERIVVSLPEEKLMQWTGNYRMLDGMILKLLLENNKLFLEVSEDQKFQLHPESENNFFIKEFDAQVSLSKGTKGNPDNFKLIQGSSVQTGRYVEPIEFSQAPPTPQELVGSYQQPDLNVNYNLTEKNGKLHLQLPDTFNKYLGFNSINILPVAGDVFSSDRLGIVEFLRNEKNEISGFKFNDVGRLRNISFTKLN
jgi:CubicO group peptidase (beta-lactamase class C family)